MKPVEAAVELARRDPVMAALHDRHGPPVLQRKRSPLGAAAGHFEALAESILYQQLAGAAAAAIHRRFVAVLGGQVTPESVLATSEPDLRGAGLSGSKEGAIRGLAAAVAEGTLPLERIARLPDDEIVALLSAQRGIGPWTAEMFLIFRLHRLDVWPVTDYGVRKGYARAYRLRDLPAPRVLRDMGEPFRPYRSIAAWYLWRAAEEPE
ncbi:MAG: DNA-3-methyladenine glycosylase [Acidimicrobiaceae bacterium]|nr:DNA-3-methyladenine glycosylase [Acidimicrobiaceae bacterium]